MEHKLAAEILKQNVVQLPAKDQGFAKSLLGWLETKNSLSDKQWFWVVKLANEITQHDQAAPDAPIEQAQPPTVVVGDFSGVIQLFKTAQQHLKWPKIRLQLPDGRPLVLALAGHGSKVPGTVIITDGKSFGTNIWYGRVMSDGVWEKSHSVDAETQDLLSTLLIKLAKAPARVAATYGKLTGNCCFCTSTLSDKRSTEVGYGPVCAKRWGQPWGKDAAPKQELKAEKISTVAVVPAMGDLFDMNKGDADAMNLLHKLAVAATEEKLGKAA
jgi:hypothetical protein